MTVKSQILRRREDVLSRATLSGQRRLLNVTETKTSRRRLSFAYFVVAYCFEALSFVGDGDGAPTWRLVRGVLCGWSKMKLDLECDDQNMLCFFKRIDMF